MSKTRHVEPTGDATGVEQLATLQDLTAKLARIASSTEVASFVLNEGIARLGGTSGSLCLVSDGELEIVANAGYPDDVMAAFARFPISEATPAGECAITRSAIYCESLEALYERYPIFRDGPIVGDPSTAVLPLESSDSNLLGTMVIGFASQQLFGESDRQLLEAIAKEASVALERARTNEALQEARQSAEEARDQLAFLAEASASLAASLDLTETMAKVAELAVPRVADRCVLYLTQGSRDIEKFLLAPSLNEAEEALFGWRTPTLEDPGGVGAVIRTGQPVFLPDVGDEHLQAAASSAEHRDLLQRVGIGGTFIVPLRVRSERIGALGFVNRRGRVFTNKERVLGEELALRAAVAIDNARLFAREVGIAETLQHALLPEVPDMGPIAAAARYLPGGEGVEVGGDWYDIVCPAAKRCVFVVGDVSGRGLKAATTMASLRFATRAYLAQGDSPQTVLERLGGLLNFEREHQFATVLIGELDVSRHRVTLASAGHFPPLVVNGDNAAFLDMPIATPVGVQSGSRPEAVSLDVAEHSRLIAFTDGLVERRGEHLDVSLERLRKAARSKHDSIESAVDQLVSALIPRGTADDVVILGLRWSS